MLVVLDSEVAPRWCAFAGAEPAGSRTILATASEGYSGVMPGGAATVAVSKKFAVYPLWCARKCIAGRMRCDTLIYGHADRDEVGLWT
jgi:hypothetical protein